MSSLERLSPSAVGERLRIAREGAGLNQAKAASSINIARTTLVAIEQGQRRIRIDELQQLAKLYGTSVNALLRQEAILVDLAPRFRKVIGTSDEAADDAASLLATLTKAEVELENLLGVKRSFDYPPERPLMPGDVRAQAEHDAIELRHRFGLGLAPVTDIVSFLEMEIGIRVYVRKLDSKISGVFVYDDALGACILLNAKHPRERRAQSAAHEFGHFLSRRREPEVLHYSGSESSREERYANAFARAFLTPVRAVTQKFQELTAGADRLTRRHVILLAHFFGVSREAIVRRLEELGLVKPGTWDWFQANAGITEEQAAQVLGDISSPDIAKADAERPMTLRLMLLSSEAYRRGLLSEGQLARLLQVDRIELRDMLDKADEEGGDADGILKLPR